jgi:hypothetical protein
VVGGPNVRWTGGLVNVGTTLVAVCPLDVVAADEVAKSPDFTSKSSPTLLMMLSRSSSDLVVESWSEGSPYLLSEGGSTIVLVVEFGSFRGISRSGPLFDEAWLSDRSRSENMSEALRSWKKQPYRVYRPMADGGQHPREDPSQFLPPLPSEGFAEALGLYLVGRIS